MLIQRPAQSSKLARQDDVTRFIIEIFKSTPYYIAQTSTRFLCLKLQLLMLIEVTAANSVHMLWLMPQVWISIFN